MTPLQVCEAIIEGRLVNREARSFFSDLPHDERHYWIASLYALLMPMSFNVPMSGAWQVISQEPESRKPV
ncbi:MAG: hypothetical protein WA397_10570 [Roseiarcus sp.]